MVLMTTLAVLVQRQDHLGGAADDALRVAADRGLRGRHHLRLVGEVVLHQEPPLALRLVRQLVRLEPQEVLCNSGDAVRGGEEGGESREGQGGDDEGHHDEDDLQPDGHGYNVVAETRPCKKMFDVRR